MIDSPTCGGIVHRDEDGNVTLDENLEMACAYDEPCRKEAYNLHFLYDDGQGECYWMRMCREHAHWHLERGLVSGVKGG